MIDLASEFNAMHHEEAHIDPWEEGDDGEEGDDSWDWQLEDVAGEKEIGEGIEGDAKPLFGIAAAQITTAAALADESHKIKPADALLRVSPDVFKQGITVIHPEYGPGKIVALSGEGKNRRATIQFATVGQKKIILAHSTVRPCR